MKKIFSAILNTILVLAIITSVIFGIFGICNSAYLNAMEKSKLTADAYVEVTLDEFKCLMGQDNRISQYKYSREIIWYSYSKNYKRVAIILPTGKEMRKAIKYKAFVTEYNSTKLVIDICIDD